MRRESRPTARTAKQLNAGQTQALLDAYQGGATVYQLGERFGIDRRTVGNILKRHGIKTRWRQMDEDDVKEAACLYEQGLSLARIADRMGLSPETVRRQLVAHGVRMRSRGGRVR